MDKKKILYLEIIRLIALYCIVYNHIGYILFEGLKKPFEISVSVLLSILCKEEYHCFLWCQERSY